MIAQQGREQKQHFIYPHTQVKRGWGKTIEQVLERPELSRPASPWINTLRGTNAQLQGLSWVLRIAPSPAPSQWGTSRQQHLGCGCVPFPITTPFLRVATSSLFFMPPSLQQALLGSVLVTPASELFKWGLMVSIILSLAFCANIMFVRLSYADSVAGVGSFPLSYSIPLNSYFIIYIFYWW